MSTDYSTQNISESLIVEIKSALQSVKNFGSIEIYIQNGVVTQITVRNIKKTNSIPQKSELWPITELFVKTIVGLNNEQNMFLTSIYNLLI